MTSWMRDKIIQKIKDYVKSLDTPDNEVYQENSLLIMSCFSKAMEIVENNSVVESDLVVIDKEKPKTYTKEEVVEILKKFKKDFPLHRGIQIMDSEFNIWIKESLHIKGKE
jgi:hypothetical protein